MDKKLRFPLIVLIMVLVNFVLLFLLMRPDHKNPEGTLGPGPNRIANELNFSEEQLRDLQPFTQKHRERMMEIDREIAKTKHAFFRQVNDTDKQRAESLLFDLGELVKDREAEVFHYMQQVKSLCTPEQESRMQKLMERALPPPPRGPGPGPGHPGPPPPGARR